MYYSSIYLVPFHLHVLTKDKWNTVFQGVVSNYRGILTVRKWRRRLGYTIVALSLALTVVFPTQLSNDYFEFVFDRCDRFPWLCRWLGRFSVPHPCHRRLNDRFADRCRWNVRFWVRQGSYASGTTLVVALGMPNNMYY